MNFAEKLLKAANEGAEKKIEKDKKALAIAESLKENSINETKRKENNDS